MNYDFYILQSHGNTVTEYESRLKNLGKEGWRVVSFSVQNLGFRDVFTALLEKEIK